MSGELHITVVGNLTQDPDLRYTPTGKTVTTVTVAQNPRIYDRESGQWKDGDAVFMRCNIWDTMAENVADSLTRGMRVVAHGQLKQRTYEGDDGKRRWVTELLVDSIGPDLRYAIAKVNKVDRDAVDPRAATTSEKPAPAASSREKAPF
ncbi:single-stranded DNA-binding protein [Nocardia sp. NPDC004068]|uniref:single-stranded DNA-binding protein n=1 Tax=Nocardia sp. NPDC004068 TaxID=3364303 RepID=UPI00369EFF6C